jgi:lactate permease
MMLLLALSPILLLVILLGFLQWSFVRSAPVVFVYTAVLAFVAWGLTGSAFISATMKGLLLATDILIIVFGAIFFVTFLRQTGALGQMEDELKALSPDRQLQAVLLAWPFGSFIEGVSGFGTAGAILAPFLVGIGFRPLTAMVIVLAANSTAVTFGAVGTPIRVGLAGLYDSELPLLGAMINFLPGLLVPLFILYFVAREEKVGRWTSFKQGLSFALIAGPAFLVPYVIFSRFGPDYPSVLGGAVALVVCIAFLARRSKTGRLTLLLKAFRPYLILLVLLVAGKVIFDPFNLRLDLGNGIGHAVRAFNPGLAFLTVIIFLSFRQGIGLSGLAQMGHEAITPLKKAFLSIFFIGSVTYLMVVTGNIDEGPGMLRTISTSLIGPALPWYSAFIGAFGSFLAGSATVSNLLFGQVQFEAAQNLDLSISLILALQITGAAAGNMVALPNILAVQAAVGEIGKERQVLGKLLLPCVIYLMAATMVALIWSRYFL